MKVCPRLPEGMKLMLDSETQKWRITGEPQRDPKKDEKPRKKKNNVYYPMKTYVISFHTAGQKPVSTKLSFEVVEDSKTTTTKPHGGS